MLEDNENIYFLKLLFVLVQPFIIMGLVILGYLIYCLIKRQKLEKKKTGENIAVLFLVIGFILQPNIVSSCLEVFRCQNLYTKENPLYYMAKEPDIKCWEGAHLAVVLCVALPFLILWGVVLPLILFKKIHKNKKNLEDADVYVRYSFIYEGYKGTSYFW